MRNVELMVPFCRPLFSALIIHLGICGSISYSLKVIRLIKFGFSETFAQGRGVGVDDVRVGRRVREISFNLLSHESQRLISTRISVQSPLPNGRDAESSLVTT